LFTIKKAVFYIRRPAPSKIFPGDNTGLRCIMLKCIKVRKEDNDPWMRDPLRRVAPGIEKAGGDVFWSD